MIYHYMKLKGVKFLKYKTTQKEIDEFLSFNKFEIRDYCSVKSFLEEHGFTFTHTSESELIRNSSYAEFLEWFDKGWKELTLQDEFDEDMKKIWAWEDERNERLMAENEKQRINDGLPF